MTKPELFSGMEEHTRKDLEALLPLIEAVFPIPPRFRRALGNDVAELSRLLTSARGERNLSYLNQPPLLSAYLYYFLPWNVYRLCRLLPGLDLPLAPGDTIIDLGSGPLSFPIGLWLCRRDLRPIPLKFRCLDRSKGALEAGKKLFTALSAGPRGGDSACPWTITTIHGDLNRSYGRMAGGDAFRLHGPPDQAPRDRDSRPDARNHTQGAALVTALNLYNELSQSISPGDDAGQRRFAKNQAALLAGLAARGGRLLVVEPGTPPAGRFITLLREALINLDRPPLSPCVHSLPCPFPAAPWPAARQNTKWCHFAFDTEDAPAKLRQLSEAAGIPKERATLSFLLAGPRAGAPAEPDGQRKNDGPQPPAEARTVRVISSPFPVGRGRQVWGCYVCGEMGMALLRGEEPLAEPGALLTVTFTGERDPKSGVPVVTG
jgi:hypothetical protein